MRSLRTLVPFLVVLTLLLSLPGTLPAEAAVSGIPARIAIIIDEASTQSTSTLFRSVERYCG